jgi:sterol 14-demethylase
LSLEQWESEFPLINLALRESIRLGLTGIDYRQNNGAKDIPIGKSGEVVPAGAFAVFQIDNVHMNPDIYQDPLKFDPSRYLPTRAEDKKVPHSYLGWGSGRHPCLGKRWANLEASILCAYFVATLEFELSDEQGKPLLDAAPQVDRKANGVGKPQQPIYLRYKPRIATT